MLFKRTIGRGMIFLGIFIITCIYTAKYTHILRVITSQTIQKYVRVEENGLSDNEAPETARIHGTTYNQFTITPATNYKYLSSVKTQLQRHFPKAMIIGMAKCGTNVLQRSLELNPLLKSTTAEEVCFSTKMSLFHWSRTFTAELPLTLESQLTFTKCPQLLNHPDAIKLLHDEFPTMKLIISLCDPVKQLVSRYTMHQEEAKETNVLPPVCQSMLKHDGTVDSTYKYVQWSIFVDMLNPVFTLFPM
ncbi:unnamed protein product, partial [Owenia fusiformis]